MTDSAASPNSQSGSLELIVRYLKDFKELIDIIVFLASGAVWTLDYFATKDELKSLREITSNQHKLINCLLDKHVQILEGEQELKNDRDELIQVMASLKNSKPSQSQLAEPDPMSVSRSEQRQKDLEQKITADENAIAIAKKAIMSRECEP
jgi:hypothetical protein